MRLRGVVCAFSCCAHRLDSCRCAERPRKPFKIGLHDTRRAAILTQDGDASTVESRDPSTCHIAYGGGRQWAACARGPPTRSKAACLWRLRERKAYIARHGPRDRFASVLFPRPSSCAFSLRPSSCGLLFAPFSVPRSLPTPVMVKVPSSTSLPPTADFPSYYVETDDAVDVIFNTPTFQPGGIVVAASGSPAYLKSCFWCAKEHRPCVISNASNTCQYCRNRRQACGADAQGKYARHLYDLHIAASR